MYSVPNKESKFWVQLFSYKATALDSYLFNSYVSGTSQVQIATLQELEEIFRAQKKELARRTQGLDPEIPLPSTLRRKGVRDPQGYILQEYMQDCSQIY